MTASGSPAVRVTTPAIDSLFDNDTEFLGDTFTLKSVEADIVAPFTTATETGRFGDGGGRRQFLLHAPGRF